MSNTKTNKKSRKKISHNSANVYISSTSNNTLLTATTKENKVFAWSSPGVVKFKGTRKSTPYAAQEAANDLSNKMNEFGVKSISLILKGLGSGKEAALKALQGRGFLIEEIIDRTNNPHNGTRLPRRRRV